MSLKRWNKKKIELRMNELIKKKKNRMKGCEVKKKSNERKLKLKWKK